MRAKSYSVSSDDQDSLADTSGFRAEMAKKIHLIAEREDAISNEGGTDTAGDMRVSVRNVLEAFQREIIRWNIWIRIYDDHGDNLPTFSPSACRAIEKIVENALQRHQSGKMLAYVEISFLINEAGTVITVEDNAPSMTAEEASQLPFLHQQNVTTLSSGYTVQATVGDSDCNTPVGQASVRCVANCFTRFSICFPH